MSKTASIRLYKASDYDQVIGLFRSNTPTYFAPEEENVLIRFLTNEMQAYFVLITENQLIGCGGVNFNSADNATICWDIIHPAFHGKGFGKELLNFRISYAKKRNKQCEINVRTSQFTYLFYEKSNFVLQSIKKDYWAKGFDLYEMVLKS